MNQVLSAISGLIKSTQSKILQKEEQSVQLDSTVLPAVQPKQRNPVQLELLDLIPVLNHLQIAKDVMKAAQIMLLVLLNALFAVVDHHRI